MIKINSVKNLSDREFDAMKSGTPIDGKMFVYVGRAWNNRYGRSLRGSPLGNPYKPYYKNKKEIDCCIQEYKNDLEHELDPKYFKIMNENHAQYNITMALEFNRILTLCTQYNEVILVCHCVESESDDQTPCHSRIIRQLLVEMILDKLQKGCEEFAKGLNP